MPSRGSYGAADRTRISFEINALGVGNSNKIVIEKENAANLAGFNGAKDVVESVCSFGEHISLFPILAIHWGALV